MELLLILKKYKFKRCDLCNNFMICKNGKCANCEVSDEN